MAAYPIDIKVMPVNEAKKLGAMALFGEKYGENVRVVNMGGYSIEFCGGCHLKNTSEAGLFKILSEGGVAAGVRRIEAVTGNGVLEYIAERNEIIEETAKTIKSTAAELSHKAAALMENLAQTQKKLDAAMDKLASAAAQSALSDAEKIGSINLYKRRSDGAAIDDIRKTGDAVKSADNMALVVTAAVTDGKITFMATASKGAVEKGIHCGKLIKEITAVAGGSGGGKPDSAQGGGKDEKSVDAALEKVSDIVKAQLG